jgi:prepilin-type N-terminal cleavage/methylation domain-containing protein
MELNRLGLAKGFTLIELAVVLVIVGVIIGMTFKGLELIDTANTRSEMQKVLKIRNSLAAWISVNAKTEAAGDFKKDAAATSTVGMYAYNFGDLEGLTNEDRKNPFGPWYLVRGVAKAEGFANLADDEGDSFFLYSDNLSKRFVCYAEILLDDDNVSTGVARTNFAGTDVKNPIGCYALNNEPVGGKFLYYRLF